MANEIDRSFDEEELEQPETQDIPDEEERTINLMNLLDFLESELNKARPVPLSKNSLVNTQVFYDIIEDIRSNVPDAVQSAAGILNERDRIIEATNKEVRTRLAQADQQANNKLQAADVKAKTLVEDASESASRMVADAEAHAERIVKDAEIRARSMLDTNTIKMQAQQEANEIIASARLEAHDRLQQTVQYCDKLLMDVESTLQQTYSEVRRCRESISRTE